MASDNPTFLTHDKNCDVTLTRGKLPCDCMSVENAVFHTERRIVEWLRGNPLVSNKGQAHDVYADAIERGEHRG